MPRMVQVGTEGAAVSYQRSAIRFVSRFPARLPSAVYRRSHQTARKASTARIPINPRT